MRITESALLPEIHGAGAAWNAPLPPFDGGDDADLVADLAASINNPDRWRLMSDWAILAFVRAIRAEFPEGNYRSATFAHQDALAQRVGYAAGSARLTMARKVMEALEQRSLAVV